jgi:hypothetical protein
VWSLLSELAHLSRLTSLTADVLRDRSGLRQLARSAPGLSGLLALSLTMHALAGDTGADSTALAAADLLFLTQLSALRELSLAGAYVPLAALPSLPFMTRLDLPETHLTPAIASTLPDGLTDVSFGIWSAVDADAAGGSSSDEEESGSDDEGGGGGGGGDGDGDGAAGGGGDAAGGVAGDGGDAGGNNGPAGGPGGAAAPPAPGPCASITRLACTSLIDDFRALMAAFPSVACARLQIFDAGVFHPSPSRDAGWRLRSLDLDARTVTGASALELLPLLGGPGGLRELRAIDGGCADLGALLAAAPQLRRLRLDASFLKDAALEACPDHASLRWLRLHSSHSAAGLTVRGLLALGRAAPGLTRLQLDEDLESALASRLEALTIDQSIFRHPSRRPPVLAPPPLLPAATEEACDGLFTVRDDGPLLPALRLALRQGVVA